MDFAEGFAGLEVDDGILLEAFVRFAPTDDGDFEHAWILCLRDQGLGARG
jgi:hypothetical protein